MALFNYSKYKIRIDPDSKKNQGLRAGDIVRRQYADSTRTVYSLMVVLDSGEEVVSTADGEKTAPYFIGALLEGDEPREGELLDFVRVSNLVDPQRSGAMYLTSSDDQSPYMDVLDGVGTAAALCYPTADGGAVNGIDITHYTCMGAEYLTTAYREAEEGIRRIYRMTRNATSAPEGTGIGLQLNLKVKIGNPQRVVVSYKVRASKPLTGVPLRLGYTDDVQTDGTDAVDISTQWQFRLSVITADYPSSVRSIYMDLAGRLAVDDWVEIAELTVNLLSDIAVFSKATTVRVGKVSGIVDPLFGRLDGYGAYFQNLYATKNVSVAGTLTAGDEKGFASTFYVGKIHKNCFLNSLKPKFTTYVLQGAAKPPAGIGKLYLLPIGTTTIECQTEEWALAHEGQMYCFSFWAFASNPHTVTVQYAGKAIGTLDIGADWGRHWVPLKIEPIAGEPMQISLDARQTRVFASPQLEPGMKPSLYQPTDETLNETEEYGAWFNRGGVGGTIQHPLLKLNDDGSIASANGSFVINPDGSGHFAGGHFEWNAENITLRDITIRWEDIQNAPGSVHAYLSSNQPYTQIYNRDTNACSPSWALSPYLVLTPSLFIGNDPDDLITTVADPATGTPGIQPASVVWYKNDKEIVSGKDSSTIGGSVQKYALTLKANAIGTYAPQMRFIFTALYLTAGGGSIPIRAEAQFTLLTAATAAIRAVAYAPDGNVFKNGEVTTLRAHCDLWRGSVVDTTKVTYLWGVRDEAVFAPTKLSKAANAGDTVITVYSTDNMVPGHILNVIYQPFTIAAVNALTNEVTLTTPLTGGKAVNCMISCPDYNAMLGAGWFPLSAENPRGVTEGWDTSEITLIPSAVQNYETFKCAVRDDDAGTATANQVVSDLITFSDMSDPIVVHIVSPDGFTIKNSGEDTDATAILMRGMQEIDPDGTLYTYQWKLYDSSGETVIRTYTGKSIVVTKGTVADKGVLMAEVYG